ncbi:uncharacterized protein TNCV_3252491 [Trichonephila clavipes]|nr:uncharacterized protein TNCV_3252491 [Trichonephila clavipes]
MNVLACFVKLVAMRCVPSCEKCWMQVSPVPASDEVCPPVLELLDMRCFGGIPSLWGYAAKTNINILDTLQNSTIRMIVKASRYMRNDDIRKAIRIKSFKFYIQKIAKKFFNSLQFTNNSNMINLNTYTPHDSTKRPRRILLDSYNPP